MKSDPKGENFLFHLTELRRHVTRCLICYVVVLLPMAAFQWDIFELVATPIYNRLGGDYPFISTRTIDPVFIPLKLVMFLSLLVSMPYIIYQIWGFVVPGLYKREKQATRPILISSVLFFYLGCSFAFFIALPLMFSFFSSVIPNGVLYQPDISSYFEFLFVMTFAFGFAFEVPIFCYILIKLNIMTLSTLTNSRPAYVLTMSALAAIFTPPDALSMILVIAPMWLLFEGSLLFLRLISSEKETESEIEDGADNGANGKKNQEHDKS